MLVFAVLVESIQVELGTRSGGRTSLAGFVAAATAVLYGWPAAALLAPLGRTLVGVTERRGGVRLVFNASVYAVAGGTAGALASLAHGRSTGATFAAALLAIAGFYLPPALLVPAAIARATSRPYLPILRHVVRLTALSFAIMGSSSLMLVVLWRVSPLYATAIVGPLLATALYQRSSKRTLDAMRLALTDPLTGLGNHRHFHEQLERELDRAASRDLPVTLCLLDLDDFKRINDTHGHLAGDDVLRAVAACVDEGGDAYRVGGDEFALLLRGVDGPQAAGIAQTVLAQLAAIECDGEPLTFSAGVASFPRHAIERTELLRVADVALYLAKRSGKNRLETATPPLLAEAAGG
jgi:diguanylate cyclase (GGDEF)-like protein